MSDLSNLIEELAKLSQLEEHSLDWGLVQKQKTIVRDAARRAVKAQLKAEGLVLREVGPALINQAASRMIDAIMTGRRYRHAK